MPYHYPLPDVIGIDVYREDVVVRREGREGHSVDWTRREVTMFSKASRQRLAFVASNTDIVFTSLLTLTYPKAFPNDGKDVKRNLQAFRSALRRTYGDVQYLWFLEFQKRGAPHIHILIRGVRVNAETQRWMSATWYRICATGDPLHLRAGTRLERIRKQDGARHYAVKYAHKMAQKAVPPDYRNVGRFWGHTKGVKPTLRSSVRCTNDDLVGALQSGGWAYQTTDTVQYRTLYGAAECLQSWMSGAILVPSTRSGASSVSPKDERRTPNASKAIPVNGGRLRANHEAGVWDGGPGPFG